MQKILHTPYLALFVALFVLNACAVQPQNFGERLAVGYATNTEVRETAAQLLNTGRLGAEEGRIVLQLTDRARALLDAAADGDERNLDLAIEILEELQRYLQ